jgi:hypothetical protein
MTLHFIALVLVNAAASVAPSHGGESVRGYQSEEYYVEAPKGGLDAAIEALGWDAAAEVAAECGGLDQPEADSLCGDWIEECRSGEWESTTCVYLDHALTAQKYDAE